MEELERECAELGSRLAGEERVRSEKSDQFSKELDRTRKEHRQSFTKMGTLLAEQRRVSGAGSVYGAGAGAGAGAVVGACRCRYRCRYSSRWLQVGGRWKAEMVELTGKFEGRLQEAARRNRGLRDRVAQLKVGCGLHAHLMWTPRRSWLRRRLR